MTEQTILTDSETRAKCCAIVLQAINKLKPENPEGVSYEQIQKWIEDNYGFYMSAVNRRCQEMAKWNPPFVEIVHDGRGRARVKVVEE